MTIIKVYSTKNSINFYLGKTVNVLSIQDRKMYNLISNIKQNDERKFTWGENIFFEVIPEQYFRCCAYHQNTTETNIIRTLVDMVVCEP